MMFYSIRNLTDENEKYLDKYCLLDLKTKKLTRVFNSYFEALRGVDEGNFDIYMTKLVKVC